MLLVPSATRVERTDTGADDLLRTLAAMLPDAWIVAGSVASKPISDFCRRGHTQPFDAIIIGERMIFVLDIWSHTARTANPQKSGFFARFHEPPHLSDEFWQDFRREIEKLKALLHDRFEVEPGRVTPEKIWIAAQFDSTGAAAADTADLRRFARAATRADRAAMFAPLSRKAVDRIANFLTDDAPAASAPTELFITDGAMPKVVARAPAPSAKPALDGSARATGGPAAAPAQELHSTKPELLLQQKAPVAPPARPAKIATPAEAPRKPVSVPEAAPPAVAKAATAAAAAPVAPSRPASAAVSRPLPTPAPAPVALREKAPLPALPKQDSPAPIVMPAPPALDVAGPAAARPAGGNGSSDRTPPATAAPIAEPGKASMPSPAAVAGALPLRAKAAEAPPETPAPIARREEASRPAPAAKAAAPVLAKASEPAAGVRATGTDGSLGQAAPSMAFARAQWRPAAQWKWLAALLLLLVVSQAGTIAWLALFDRASPHSGAAPRAATAPPAAPASAAPVPEPFVVRSLATSTPMLVGSETVTIRAGPSPDFASVGNLDAGTEVVASASADGPGGSSWIEITAANGAIGFVPDNMVQPRQVPVLTAEQAAPPEPAPTPKIKRAAASTQTPTKVKRAPVKLAAAPAQSRPSKIRRAVASKQSPTPKLARATRLARASRPEEAPAPPRIACILPGGGEVQATRSDCRAQSGIIYQ